ncbi:hypothetical protein GCM10027168_50170 [Streptomyces capparidis]
MTSVSDLGTGDGATATAHRETGHRCSAAPKSGRGPGRKPRCAVLDGHERVPRRVDVDVEGAAEHREPTRGGAACGRTR